MSSSTKNIKSEAEAEINLPVAQATVIAVTSPSAPTASAAVTTSATPSTGYVEIPANSCPKGSITFTGAPIQIGKLSSQMNFPGLLSGAYVQSIHILLPTENWLMVSHLHQNAPAVQQLWDANSHLPRRLCLSGTPPRLLNRDDGFYYTHTLPAPCDLESLQLQLSGFPPIVKTVGQKSPLQGIMHPHQVLVELKIPAPMNAKLLLNEKTPGFTAYKVQQELQLHSQVEGVQLTVKDVLVHRKKEKGSSKALHLEDCVIM